MTDFLTNLAARTLAQPALLPRSRGRFEPAAAEAAPLVWPEPENNPERGGDRSGRVSTEPKAVAAATALQTVAEEPQQVEATSESPRRTLPPRPVPVAPQREERRETAVPARAPSPSPSPAPTSKVEPPHEVDRETVIEVVTQTQPAAPSTPARTTFTRTATAEPQAPHRHDEVPPRIGPAQAPDPPPQRIEPTTRTTIVHTRRAAPAKSNPV